MDMLTLLAEDRRLEAEALAARPLSALIGTAGRTAVVTGAARGIGLAIARRIAESGADLVLADRSAANLEQALASLPEADRARASTFAVDVADPKAVAALADHAVARTGRLDIWVNNAGIYPATGALVDAGDDALDSMLAVNVKGVFHGAREAARRMGRGGVILNTASIGAFRGQSGMSSYAASKHAVLGLTRSLALELGPVGIRVLAIAPGLTITPGTENALEAVQAAGHSLASLGAPLGRIALPDDIARVALFAVSDLAAMMTGQLLTVDGGATV